MFCERGRKGVEKEEAFLMIRMADFCQRRRVRTVLSRLRRWNDERLFNHSRRHSRHPQKHGDMGTFRLSRKERGKIWSFELEEERQCITAARARARVHGVVNVESVCGMRIFRKHEIWHAPAVLLGR